MPQDYRFGEIDADRSPHGGWIVGHFIESDPFRCRRDVEVKWACHRAGESKTGGFASNRTATTLSIVIGGRFRIRLRSHSGDILADEFLGEGRWVMWGPGVAHDWEAPDDCTVVSVRWPSVDGDQES